MHRPRATGRVLCLVLSVVASACGGPAATQPPGGSTGPDGGGVFPTLAPPPVDLSTVPSAVHVEDAGSTAAWIGPAGGTLAATAADGTAYRLEIPAYAVRDATAITMTPVNAIDGLGLSGGLAGGVFLQPAGLELAVPAALTITTAKAAPDGFRLAGFDIPDGGGTAGIVPTTASGDGRSISVAVFHFSAPGAAYGTTQDLATISQAAIPTTLAGLLTLLLADPTPWDATTKAENGLIIDLMWAGSPLTNPPGQGLRHAIEAAASDAALLQAVKDWRTFVFALNLWAFGGDAAAALAAGEQYAGGVRASHTAAYLDGQSLLATQFLRAIDGNETICNQSHDLHALANMWFWAGLGERYSPVGEDWPARARGCASLEVGVANLPTNLQAGGSDNLGLTFVLAFADGTKVPADVEATLQSAGFTFAPTGAATMTGAVAGTSTLTAGVVATQGPPYTLTVRACWYLEGLARNLCSQGQSFSFGAGATPTPGPQGSGAGAGLPDLTGTYRIVGRSSSGQKCGSQFTFTGSATAVQTGNKIAVTWTFDALTTPDADSCLMGEWAAVIRSGSFTGTLVGSMTEGFRIVDIPRSCGVPNVSTVGLVPTRSFVIPNDCGQAKVFARADFRAP